MKITIKLPPKIRSTLFSITYTPQYKTLIPSYVLTDPWHPLYISQRRRAKEKKKEGLWWHATTGTELSKSGCVRAWVRRRIRHAVTEELRLRGYDEKGLFLDRTPQQGSPPDLTGSLRIHALVPLISAKFVQVKADIGHMIDALIKVDKSQTGTNVVLKKKKAHPQHKSSRRQNAKKPNATQ